jgi:hypothetical protein
MSFISGTGDSRYSQSTRAAPNAGTQQEERQVARSGRIATGTLACNRCDAPVALTAGPVSPTDFLTCPFCDHRARARDFLSLGAPTRPARVQVHAIYRTR